MIKSKSAIVPKKLNEERFDIAATELFPELSRKKIKLIIDSGGAYLNKKRIQIAKYSVKQNDKIELFWEEKSSNTESDKTIQNKKTSFSSFISGKNIIFEHKDFFVINKPAGIATQATLTSSTDTIFHMLNKLDNQKFKLEQLFMVHRLDKDTSGILLIARNKQAQKKFEDLFKLRQIEKKYDAICFGTPNKKEGYIQFAIAKDNSRPNCYFAVTNPNSKIKDAKGAETSYKVTQNFQNQACLIECSPKTGRTHQIRVHLTAIGNPIFGDKTYAQNIYGHPFSQLALRQMLHAKKIEFKYESQSFCFECDYPDDFLNILKKLDSSSVTV